MLKVMIVDDEMIVRVGIQSCIRWEDYGCQISAACASGREACTHFEKEVPDIVFTDIMMPEMNGIELITYIRKNYPLTKIVVLSCVNEIEYVKQAIRLGAEDYILKLSFTRDMLAGILAKLKAAIEEEGRKIGSEHIYSSIRTLNREEAFRTLLSKKLDQGEKNELLDRLGYPYNPFEQYQTACLLIEPCGAESSKHTDTDIMRYGLLNIIREYFGKQPQSELIFLAENEIMTIFRLTDNQVMPESLTERLGQMNHALRTHLNITLSVGLNPEPTGRNGLEEAYRKAGVLARLRFFSGCGSCHDHEDAPGSKVLIKRRMQKEMQEAVFLIDAQKAFKAIDTCFSGLGSIHNHQRIPAIRRSVVETWLYILGNTIPDQEDLPEYNDIYPLSRFWEAETLMVLKDCLKEAVQMIIDYLAENKSINPEISRFLLYLEDHVGENISLEQAAARCALGKSQFCVLFKKATGETFINYFNGLKMKKAYVLLGSGNIQVQEAAAQIGIRDISYFSRMFKKYYRVSPSEVRRL